MRSALVLCVALSLSFGLACSSFKSSSSPSRWSSESIKASSSPFRWSSRLSRSGGTSEEPTPEEVVEEVVQQEVAHADGYERDLIETTVSIVSAGGGPEELSRSIYPVAHEHGIMDFSGHLETYRSIGRGLAEAKLSLYDFEKFQEHLAQGSELKRQLLMEGFTSAR